MGTLLRKKQHGNTLARIEEHQVFYHRNLHFVDVVLVIWHSYSYPRFVAEAHHKPQEHTPTSLYIKKM